jgi:hypothetical protein
MMRQFRLLQFTRPETSTILPPPHDRRPIAARPFVVLRPRPPPWPSNIIEPPSPGDNRTPLERWRDWHFEWEAHFY